MLNKIIKMSRLDENFPNKLKTIKPCVNTLYAIGNTDLLDKKTVAIVGSRNCSEYGIKMAKKITEELIAHKIVVVSGLANGIDTVAHKTCVEHKKENIAVLGSGFNKIYPKENTDLFKEILEENGLILSEYSPEEQVQKKNFPKRNRIISALADAVLIVEGAYRSGTSITAKYAVLQGKKLFYVPNCIGNKNSFECIKLAKEGATIATCGADILNEIGIHAESTYKNKLHTKKNLFYDIVNSVDQKSKKIITLLMEQTCIDSNQISLETNINIADVNQVLTNLELKKIVKVVGYSKYQINEEFCE